jgi:hypothetical protein
MQESGAFPNPLTWQQIFKPSNRTSLDNPKFGAYPQSLDPLGTERVPTFSNRLTWEISIQPTKIQAFHPNFPRQPKIWCIPPTPGPSRNRDGPDIVQPLNLRNINPTNKDSTNILIKNLNKNNTYEMEVPNARWCSKHMRWGRCFCQKMASSTAYKGSLNIVEGIVNMSIVHTWIGLSFWAMNIQNEGRKWAHAKNPNPGKLKCKKTC